MPSESYVVRITKPASRLSFAACAVIALLQVPVFAQAAAWTQVATFGATARRGHAMAYDSQRGRTVLFGGVTPPSTFGDTWEWDGTTWMLMATTGPTARSYPAMAYDSQRGRTVMFGGYDGAPSLSYNRDTWEWNGSMWTLMSNTGPTARVFHAMAYDSQRGRTVLFGGDPVTGDTWEWDGSTWTLMATTGPPRRRVHAMVYDTQRGRTVLFGGVDNLVVGPFGDTWEWDGSTWTQRTGLGPPSRHSHAMAFDSQRGRTVLFGGYQGSPNVMGDTWEWDGNTWTLMAHTGPAARYWHALVFDSQRGRTVLFGGYDRIVSLGDTWEWAAGIATAASFGAGCGSPALVLSPIATARPIINTTAQASLTNVPVSLAFVALGWSRTTFGPLPLPLSLLGYGMPGCDLLQSCEEAALPTTSTVPGTATLSVPLPNWSGLIGLHLYLQGWAIAPGANAGNLIVSNALEWAIGNS